MLLKRNQIKHVVPDGDGQYKFVDDGKVSKDEMQAILDLDAAFYEVYQDHIITNREELKKKALCIRASL